MARIDGMGAVSAPAPALGMRGRVLRGVAWKAGSTAFGLATRLIVAAILAHLLSPHDYGVAGMVLAFSALVFLFADLSFGPALVQRRELTEEDRSTVFWTSAVAGAAFTALGIGLSGPVAAFYGEPQVQPLFAALSLAFFIGAISSTQMALLTREMDFRSLELREIGSALLAGGIGIGVALKGFGAWALIAQNLTAAAVSTVLLWLCSPWRPRLVFSWSSLRNLGGYSGNVFGSRLLFMLNRNADNILIGRFLGPAALGAYAIAYNLMLIPLSQISLPLQEVLFPAFSRMQEDVRRIAEAWFRANRFVGAITIPGMLGLMVVAPDFVAVVLGDQWRSATTVLQILAWVGLLQSLQGLNGSVLRAVDRTGTLLRYSVVVLVASLIAFVAGLPWGILGVATAYAVSSTLVEPFYAWLTARSVQASLLDYYRAVARVAQAAVVMAASVLLARVALVDLGAPPFLRLVVLILLGVLVYVPCVAWREPELVGEVRELRRRGLAR